MKGAASGRFGRNTRILSVALVSIGMLAACENDDSSEVESSGLPGDAMASLEPMALNTREDVIRAVSSVWAAVSEWGTVSAPVRPTPAEAPAEGESSVTEPCSEGGQVTYNEGDRITSFDSCTEVVEETDEATEEVVRADRLTINGNIDEDCQLAEGEVTTADHRCVGFIALSSEQSTTITEPAADEDAESTSSQRNSRASQDALIKVFAETEDGFTLEVDQVARRDLSREDTNGVVSESSLSWETARLDVAITNGDASFIAFDGEFRFSTDDNQRCSAGLVRVGTTEDLQFTPDSQSGPSAGEFVLSTSEVGALAVTVNADTGISFTLGDEAITVTGEEMNGGCVETYIVPGDGTDDPSGQCSGVEFMGFCFPDGISG